MKWLWTAPLAGVLTLWQAQAWAEWVVTVYTGVSHTFASDVRIRQGGSDATFAAVAWAPHPFSQGAPYYGVRITYFPRSASHAGALLDFTHYKMYAETADLVPVHGVWNGAPVHETAILASRVQRLQISHGVNLTSISGEYRWNPVFAPGVWQTHAGAGLVVYLPHAEGVIDGTSVSGGYEYGGFGGQIFGGTEYGLTQHLGLLLEGKFDAGSLDLNLDPQTRIETDVRSLHLIGGISWHF